MHGKDARRVAPDAPKRPDNAQELPFVAPVFGVVPANCLFQPRQAEFDAHQRAFLDLEAAGHGHDPLPKGAHLHGEFASVPGQRGIPAAALVDPALDFLQPVPFVPGGRFARLQCKHGGYGGHRGDRRKQRPGGTRQQWSPSLRRGRRAGTRRSFREAGQAP